MIALMARLRIVTRIAAGFGLVLALLVVVVIVGHRNGGTMMSAFDLYEADARRALAVADVDRLVTAMQRHAEAYAETGAATEAEAVTATLAELRLGLDTAAQPALAARLEAFAAGFRRLVALRGNRDHLVAERLEPAGARGREALAEIMRSALFDGALEAAALGGQAQEALMTAQLTATRFLAAPDPDLVKATNGRIAAFVARAQLLEMRLRDPRRKELATAAVAEAEAYRDTFAVVATDTLEIQALVTGPLAGDAAAIGRLCAEARAAAETALDDRMTATDAAIEDGRRLGLLLGVVAVVLGLVAATAIALGVVLPVRRMTAAMTALASGDLSVPVPAIGHRDEIGAMAAAVQVFKDSAERVRALEAERAEVQRRAAEDKRRALDSLAETFRGTVGAVVDGLSSAAVEMEGTARSMSSIAEEAQRQATMVAAAAGQASGNVQTVAGAAEQLTASIAEIGQQVQRSSEIAAAAAERAEATRRVVHALDDAAGHIGEVVDVISAIADQTNLLALNATIEAARAGEAGRGFAVVAEEVKHLATQTSRATGEIARQIGEVQQETHAAVAAIQDIVGIIGEVDGIAASIARAVEEQTAATREIARNVQQASAGTTEVSTTILGVTQAAGETGAASEQVVGASRQLAGTADTLRAEVEHFLDDMRHAA